MHAARDAGADAAINTSLPGWRNSLRAIVPDAIDLEADPVGGQLTQTDFRTLRWGGRLLVLGFADGDIPAVRSNLAFLKGASMIGVDVRQFREREPARARACLADVTEPFSSGVLRPHVAATYPPADLGAIWCRGG